MTPVTPDKSPSPSRQPTTSPAAPSKLQRQPPPFPFHTPTRLSRLGLSSVAGPISTPEVIYPDEATSNRTRIIVNKSK